MIQFKLARVGVHVVNDLIFLPNSVTVIAFRLLAPHIDPEMALAYVWEYLFDEVEGATGAKVE